MKQPNINRWAGHRGNDKQVQFTPPDGGEFLAAENHLKSMIGNEAFNTWSRNISIDIVTNRARFLDVVKGKIREVNHCACHNCKTRRETIMVINAMKARIEYGLVTLPELIKLEERYIERYEKQLSDLICSIHGKQS